MSWQRFDDRARESLKVRRAGTSGTVLWWAAGNWCSDHLTDGRIPKDLLPDVWRPIGEPFATEEALAACLSAGLFFEDGDDIVINDYLEFNPSKKRVLADRAAAKLRQQRKRQPPPQSRDTPRESQPVSRRDTPRESHDPLPVPSRPVPDPATAGSSRGAVDSSDAPAGWARVLRIFDDAWRAEHGTALGLSPGGNGHQRGSCVHRWAAEQAGDDWERLVAASASAAARDPELATARSPFAVWAASPGRWRLPEAAASSTRMRMEFDRLHAEVREAKPGPSDPRIGRLLDLRDRLGPVAAAMTRPERLEHNRRIREAP